MSPAQVQPQIEDAIENRRFSVVRELVQDWEPADLADLIQEMEPEDRGVLFRVLPRELAALTRADVAASVDLTGAAALGGNWSLEYVTGAVEAGSVFEAAVLESFQGVLADYTVQSGDATLNRADLPEALRDESLDIEAARRQPYLNTDLDALIRGGGGSG